MAEDKKHNDKIVWQDFLDYLTRTFTKHEMHHFERKVDKSAFDTEALEGLEKFAGVSMDNDIELLKDHIHKRNTLFGPKPATHFTLKNVAAIAIIVVISGILVTLLISRNGKMDEQLVQNNPVLVPDSVEKVQMIAQQNLQHKTTLDEIEVKKSAQKDEKDKSLETTPTTHSSKPINSPLVVEIDDESITEVELKKEEFELMADKSKNSQESISSVTQTVVFEQNTSSSASHEVALLTAKKQVISEGTTPDTMPVLHNNSEESLNENDVHPIRPETGNEEFTLQLKQWLEEQKMENSGEIKIKLIFGKNMTLKTVSIVEGINSDTDKAIQYYILNKTKWISDDKNVDSGKEEIYSFSL